MARLVERLVFTSSLIAKEKARNIREKTTSVITTTLTSVAQKFMFGSNIHAYIFYVHTYFLHDKERKEFVHRTTESVHPVTLVKGRTHSRRRNSTQVNLPLRRQQATAYEDCDFEFFLEDRIVSSTTKQGGFLMSVQRHPR